MEINLNKAFKNAFGEELTENGKPVIMNNLIVNYLYNGVHIKKEEERDALKKIEAYKLSMKLADAKGEVEITTEEAVLIKSVAALLSPGPFGQICDLIEGSTSKRK